MCHWSRRSSPVQFGKGVRKGVDALVEGGASWRPPSSLGPTRVYLMKHLCTAPHIPEVQPISWLLFGIPGILGKVHSHFVSTSSASGCLSEISLSWEGRRRQGEEIYPSINQKGVKGLSLPRTEQGSESSGHAGKGRIWQMVEGSRVKGCHA